MKKKIFALMALIGSMVLAEDFKVMSFNVRNSKDSTAEIDGKHNWPVRKNLIKSFIDDEKFDIIGIQEAFNDQVIFLNENLPLYNQIGVGRDDGAKKGEHSNILYNKEKFTFVDGGTFWLSETPEKIASIGWDAELPRIATWVRLESKESKEKILVFNTHFDHVGMKAQEESAKLLAQKTKEITDSPDELVIVLGDLNFERTNTNSYQAFTKNYRDAKIITETPFEGVNYTYNGFGKNPIEEIDYIFVNKNLNVKSYKQLEMKKDGVYYSDHNAIIAELKSN